MWQKSSRYVYNGLLLIKCILNPRAQAPGQHSTGQRQPSVVTLLRDTSPQYSRGWQPRRREMTPHHNTMDPTASENCTSGTEHVCQLQPSMGSSYPTGWHHETVMTLTGPQASFSSQVSFHSVHAYVIGISSFLCTGTGCRIDGQPGDIH